MYAKHAFKSKDSYLTNIYVNYYQYSVKIHGRGNARHHDLVLTETMPVSTNLDVSK